MTSPATPFVMKTTDPPALASISYAAEAGQPVAPDTVPTWAESSGGAVIALSPSADGTNSSVTPVGPGTSTITVTELDFDGNSVVTTIAVEVLDVADEPATGTITITPGAVTPVGSETPPTATPSSGSTATASPAGSAPAVPAAPAAFDPADVSTGPPSQG